MINASDLPPLASCERLLLDVARWNSPFIKLYLLRGILIGEGYDITPYYTPMVGFMPLLLLVQNVKPTVYSHVQGTWLTPHENITINIVALICINHELSWLYFPLSSIIPFICRLWFNHHWQLPSCCRGGILEKSLTSAFGGGVATGRACDGILANAEGLAMEVCCPQVI